MEDETEGLVGLLRALVVEEVGDDLIADGEEGAAGGVGRGVLAVGTGDAAGERGYEGSMSQPHPW